MIKVLLAHPHGFCAGVVMAIRSLQRALELLGPPLYVYHEIIHNGYIVRRFKDQGVIFVDDIEDVPLEANVLYSAHGVSPQIRQQAARRNLYAIDATCPLVSKVHLEARKFMAEGYSIVLIGHRGHDEVVGVMGEAPHTIWLVENAEDVDRLELPDPQKVAYLTQTTLSVDDAERVIAALRRRYPDVVGPAKEDICYATQNRQEALRVLVSEGDCVFVVGSHNSSNANRLVEVAAEHDVPAYLIDSADDIDPIWLSDVETLVVTAGASTPEDLVQNCLNWLSSNFDVEIIDREIRQENVDFPLPKELRTLAALDVS